MTRRETLEELFARRESEGRPVSPAMRAAALDEAAMWDAFDDYCARSLLGDHFDRFLAGLNPAPVPDTFRRLP